MNRNRFETFSDGVFAIAITLLVLEIRVPTVQKVTSAQLWHALVALWPQYLSYVTSFLIIGIYWLNHHSAFHYIRYLDRGMVWRNLVLLMLIAFIPFPTAVIGRYGGLPSAVFFYGLTLFVTAAYVNFFWWHTVRHGYLDPALVTAAEVRKATIRYAAGAIVYLAAMAIALFAPRVSIALYLLLPVFYLLPGGLERNVILPEESSS